MKKLLFVLFFSLSVSAIIAQSSIILPNGNVIPSFTQANRPSTNRVVGQLIYQTDGTSGLYVWNGTTWTAVSSGSGGSGTVTSVTSTAPITVTNGSTTPQISLSQSNGTTNGFLSSVDWNIFNNKQNTLPQANGITNGFLSSVDWSIFNNKFSLPSLSNGSLLFSNGTTISENNTSLNWNNTLNRLDIKGLNDGSVNAGYTNWIAQSVGGSAGNRVVLGVQNGNATIGGHTNLLDGWAKLVINPAGPTAIGALQGVGTRMVVANADGEVSTQAIPTGNVGTVTNVVGTSPISVSNGTSTPTVAISQANTTTDGFLSSFDWNTFNSKQSPLSNANGSTSGILTNTDWTTFNNKFTLPNLTNGSVVFSNGTNLSQNNGNIFWENTNARLGIGTNTPNSKLTVSSTNPGSGTNDWVAGNFGGLAGDRVVIGNLNSKATISAHNNALTANSELVLNPGGVTNIATSLGVNNLSSPQGVLDVAQTTTNYTGTFSRPPLVLRSCNSPGNFNPYLCDYPFDGNANTFAQANSAAVSDGALKVFAYYVVVGHTTQQRTIRRYRVFLNSIFNPAGTTTARIQLFGFNNDGGRVMLDDFTTSGVTIDAIRNINNTTPFDGYEVVLPFSGFTNTTYPNDRPWVSEVEFYEESSELSFNSGGFTVKADGKVGVGTNAPTSNLDVVGSLRLRNGAMANSLLMSDVNGNTTWSNNISLANIQATNVGIGVAANNSNKMIVNGTGGIKVSSTNSGTGSTDWIASNIGGTAGDRVISGNLNGAATIGAHNNALNGWSNLVINNTAAAGATVTIGNDANAAPTNATETAALNTKLIVNGSIRQGYYSTHIDVPANNVTYVTWNHNLGYGPIVMMSTDQNGGGAYMDYCTYTTYNNSANQTVFVIRNMGGNNASGTFRWILVW
jgi:hypothetical protein